MPRNGNSIIVCHSPMGSCWIIPDMNCKWAKEVFCERKPIQKQRYLKMGKAQIMQLKK